MWRATLFKITYFENTYFENTRKLGDLKNQFVTLLKNKEKLHTKQTPINLHSVLA